MENPSYKFDLNNPKNHFSCFKYDIFCFQFFFFSKAFRAYIRMENPSYKNKNVERKYFDNMKRANFYR